MTSRLPSRRFREAQVLAGVGLLLPLAFVVVLVQGLISQSRVVVAEAGRSAQSVARLVAAVLIRGGPNPVVPPLPDSGVAIIEGEEVSYTDGSAGPDRPAWWPWRGRGEWERSGRALAGPIPLAGDVVVVAYAPVGSSGAVRVVERVPVNSFGRWGWRLGVVILLAAGGGAAVAWVMISRSLAPYDALLAEAVRVARPGPGDGEDHFLVETFRSAVRRLEASEAELRQRADELAVLADVLTRGSEAGVVITDPEGCVRAFNASAVALAGAALDPGGPLPSSFDGAEGRQRLGDRVVEVRRMPLHSPDGRTQGEALFLADRTHVEALERSVQEQQQLVVLGEMAAGMAHELRNGLATIEGYVRLLPEADGEALARYREAIAAETATVGEVLDRFLQFARPQRLRIERVGLRRVAENVVGRLCDAGTRCRFTIEGADAIIDADPLAVGVVLENILRNSSEVGSRHTTLTIDDGPTTVRVIVDDDGPGVAPEVRERLFSPFVTTKPSGGIGLALARRLVRLHGGDLTSEERGGPGARFVISFPVERHT